jgi:hypothetical protein
MTDREEFYRWSPTYSLGALTALPCLKKRAFLHPGAIQTVIQAIKVSLKQSYYQLLIVSCDFEGQTNN